MIKPFRPFPIRWPKRGSDIGGPFLQSSGRPLRLTIYCPLEAATEVDDGAALNILRELGFLEDIDSADTAASTAAHLAIGTEPTDRGFIPVTVTSDRSVQRAGIHDWHVWNRIQRELFSDSEGSAALPESLILGAHHALNHDLLVTTSPRLLQVRGHRAVQAANICTPTHGLKLAGLLLRSRRRFVVYADRVDRNTEDQLLFYSRLAWSYLRPAWAYAQACARAPEALGVSPLWNSVLWRSRRALEACDYIGAEYHKPQNNYTRDAMLYHFDYLMLLLLGIFDAQARIAKRLHGLSLPDRQSSFWSGNFVRMLDPASSLRTLLQDAETIATFTIVKTLRNTIHGAQLQPLGIQGQGAPQTSAARVVDEEAKKIPTLVAQLGGTNEWGVTAILGVEIEPFQCALTSTRRVLNLAVALALATDIERLGGNRAAQPPTGDSWDSFTPFHVERALLTSSV